MLREKAQHITNICNVTHILLKFIYCTHGIETGKTGNRKICNGNMVYSSSSIQCVHLL